MSPVTLLAIYIMIWWVTLFCVLPFGNRASQHEAGVDAVKGTDPGAPVFPGLKKKLLINSGVAFVVWLIFVIVTAFHMINI